MISIFNFHHVDPDESPSWRKHISVTPEGLRKMIRVSRSLGFTILSMREVLENGVTADYPPKSMLLTFDDGFENFHDHAVPVLIEEKCPATVFALGGKPGLTNDWDQEKFKDYQPDKLMTFDQMRACVADTDLITFGSHGMLHQDYSQLNERELSWELNTSHEILVRELGEAYLPIIAYPWGKFSKTTLKIMLDTPYSFGFTTQKGRWDPLIDAFKSPRYSVYFRDSNPWIYMAKLLRNGLLV